MYKDFVEALSKKGPDILAEVTPEDLVLMHAAFGIVSEVGELRMGVNRSDTPNVIEECGDILFFAEMALQSFGETLDIEVMENRRFVGFYQISTMAFELADLVKSQVIYRKNRRGEIITLIWNIVQGVRSALSLYDADLPTAVFENVRKLQIRYPKLEFNLADANARADKA